MCDVIHLTSEDEEIKEKPTREELERKGSNVRKRRGHEGFVKESLTTDEKGNPSKEMKRRGSNLYESRDCEGVTRENWSTYHKFLEFCWATEVTKRNGDSKLMRTILDKLSRRFKDADPDYTQSGAFRESVKSAQNLVESDPSNLFVFMKQVGDELKLRSVKSKNNNHKGGGEDGTVPKKRLKMGDNEVSEDEEQDKSVNKRHCKKLEIIFEKVYRKVKKLEEKEVDWDEEENSVYIRLERYKKRLYAIWEKWQEVRGRVEEVKKLKYRKIAFSGTQYPDLDHAIEKFVNKTKCFPDFMDIHKLTSQTLNKEPRMDIPEEQIKSIATAAFQILGNQLQKVRVFDFWNCCMSYLPSATDIAADVCDPADNNEELSRALEENKKNYSKKLKDAMTMEAYAGRMWVLGVKSPPLKGHGRPALPISDTSPQGEPKVVDSFVVKQVDEEHEAKEVVLGTDDEGSAPSGDDDEEEEEEDDEPEDIICISSSTSEDSANETETDVKQSQINEGEHSSNGNLQNKVKHKEKMDDNGESQHVAGNNKRKSLVCKEEMEVEEDKGLVKMEADKSLVKMEPTPSCSSVQENQNGSSSNGFSGKKKTKTGGNLEIVILSETDSED